MSSNTIGLIFPFENDSYIPYQDLFYMGGTGLGQISVTPLAWIRRSEYWPE